MAFLISFGPQLRFDTLAISLLGETITINGDALDLSAIVEGATLPLEAIDNEWILDPIERIDGDIKLKLILPIGSSDPEPWQLDPAPMVVTADGPIDIPSDTTVSVETERVVGGTNVITTTRRWRQAPETAVEFVPDAPPPANAAQEADHAD